MGLIVRARHRMIVRQAAPKDPLDQLLAFLRRIGQERAKPWIPNPKRRRRYAEAIERLARMLEDGIPPHGDRAQINPFPNEHRARDLNQETTNTAPFGHSRFYATIRPFRLACPKCNKILLLGYGQSHMQAYDPISSLLRCTGCQRVFQLGIIAWPVNANTHRSPIDHQLTYRQIAEIRQLAGGFWADTIKGQGEPVNLAAQDPCSCPSPRDQDPRCPVHGQPPKEPPCSAESACTSPAGSASTAGRSSSSPTEGGDSSGASAADRSPSAEGAHDEPEAD